MVKYDSALDVSDSSEGSVTILPKAANSHNFYLRLDWTSPYQEQMAFIGENFQIYRPNLNQVFVGISTERTGN